MLMAARVVALERPQVQIRTRGRADQRDGGSRPCGGLDRVCRSNRCSRLLRRGCVRARCAAVGLRPRAVSFIKAAKIGAVPGHQNVGLRLSCGREDGRVLVGKPRRACPAHFGGPLASGLRFASLTRVLQRERLDGGRLKPVQSSNVSVRLIEGGLLARLADGETFGIDELHVMDAEKAQEISDVGSGCPATCPTALRSVGLVRKA